MENVCLRLDKSLVRELEVCMKEFKYSTKTELIRDALRDKLKKLREESNREKAWTALFAARGSLKGQGKFKTDEEWHDWRTNVFSKQLEEEFSKKYGLKP